MLLLYVYGEDLIYLYNAYDNTSNDEKASADVW